MSGAGDFGRKSGPRLTPRGIIGVGLSVAFHILLVAAFFLAKTPSPLVRTARPITVALIAETPPPAPMAPLPPLRPAITRPPPPPRLFKPTPAPRNVASIAAERSSALAGDGVSETDLAGAATSGSGGGGRACDMLSTLQAALRKDRLVRAAVSSDHLGAAAARTALRVWNGDWVTSGAEDGKGLATVREAIMWEIAFAPKECREEPVHGLVVITLAEIPGVTRLVIGQGDWRWSDLLTPR